MSKRTGGFIGQDGINAPDPATGVTGTAGDASVSVAFTAPTDVGASAITGYSVQSADGSGTWQSFYDIANAVYNGKGVDVDSEDGDVSGLFIKPDGLTLYIAGQTNDNIYQYALTTAWDISTATYDSKTFSVSSQDANPLNLSFKSDGTKMYVLGGSNSRVFQYSLSTAWDVSTASYDSVSFNPTSQASTPRGFDFKDDGTKIYQAAASNDTIYQYSLSTAWDLSTASYDSVSFYPSDAMSSGFPAGLRFGNSGKVLFISNGSNVYKYTLSTGYDLSTASFVSGSLDLTVEDSDPKGGIMIEPDGLKFYSTGGIEDRVFQYSIAQLDYPAASPVIVTGLSNGTSYTFNVWAINPFGWSSPSDASDAVSPAAPRGIFAGGFTGSSGSNVMDYISITSTGNANDFGDLSATLYNHGGFSSSTRGITGGGLLGGSVTNVIEYVTIATTGNSTDFGDLLNTIFGNSGCANSTRGLILGGYTAPNNQDLIQYVTIATTGNSTDFGNLLSARRYLCGTLASPTRGVTSGGEGVSNSTTNVIQYMTIATTGNATDFGDLSVESLTGSSSCNSTRGLISLGKENDVGPVNTVEYITIASTGNSIDFGNLTAVRQYTGSTSGGDRAVVGGGENSGALNTIDYFTITSAGNATDFGDLTVARGRSSTMSNAHGGL